MIGNRTRSIILYLLFFFSGAAALGYQLIWSKLFAVGLGHEMASVLAVICAFMGGMALGACLIDRWSAWSPIKTLAVIELVIGGWGAMTALLLPPINNFALQLSGLGSPLRQWLVCFAVPLFALLPATMAMGASFPVMERCISTLRVSGQTVPGVYAANTFGAVAGTYFSIFVIAPAVGLHRTLFCLAAMNLICAFAAFALRPRPSSSIRPIKDAAEHEEEGRGRGRKDSLPTGLSPNRLLISLFFTGLLGMAVETVSVRVLSQVLENTVYSFAAVLAVFLLGTASGAAIFQRLRRAPSPRLLAMLVCGLGLSILSSILVLDHGPAIYDFGRSHAGRYSTIVAEALVAATALGLPSALMGATFSLLAQAWRDIRGTVAKAAAINTAGAALGPLLFSVVVLPLVGAKWALVMLAVGYFALVPAFTLWLLLGTTALTAAALALMPSNLHILNFSPQDKRVRAYRDGITASVAVVEDTTHHRTLRVNNHFQMGGTGAADAEYRHAHLPLLLHPNPKQALVLGLGTGITLGGASIHPDLKIDGVELLPEVVDVMPQFEPYTKGIREKPSVQIHVADARRFVKLTTNKYDVIIADLFHPAADGAGNLYTIEHFRGLREHLAANGICCQWLPLHQLDLPMFRVITKTFLQIFPDTHAYLLRFNVDAPVVGLIGSLSPRRYPPNWIEQRLTGGDLEAEIKRLSLADSVRFFGHYLAGSTELSAFCSDAPINTDDQPIVIFRAPEFTYRKDQSSYALLHRLLNVFKPKTDVELTRMSALQPISDAGFNARLSRYFVARNIYIDGLIAEAEGNSDKAIDAFIESARLSEDFTPGYAQCLSLASVEARSNPAKARRLLERLVEAQPTRPVARELMNRLFPP